MDSFNIVVLGLGLVCLLFVVITYTWNPLRWQFVKGRPAILTTFAGPQRDCPPLQEFVKGHEKVIFVGLTLDTICEREHQYLEGLAKTGKVVLHFFLASPGREANPLLEAAARGRGSGVKKEDIRQEIKETMKYLRKVRTAAANPEDVQIRTVDYLIGPSMVMVDPFKPDGMVRLTVNSFSSNEGERLVLDITSENRRAYDSACGLYTALLANSKSI
jgi:hypothetical protein